MIVIDDFIKDEPLLKAIDEDKSFIGDQMVIICGGMVGGIAMLIHLKNN